MTKAGDNIKISENRLTATLEDTSDINSDKIISALQINGIKGIINRELISSLGDGNNFYTDRDPIIIAEAPATLRAKCSRISEIETLQDFESLYGILEKAGKNLSEIKKANRIDSDMTPSTVFVKSGEIFLTIKESEIAENLYGESVYPERTRSIKYDSKCIKEDSIGTQVLYYAEKSGYLVSREGKISIENPVFDIDEFERYYIFYPVRTEKAEIEKDYKTTIDTLKEKYSFAPIPLPDMLNDEEPGRKFNAEIKEVSKGTRPVEGIDAVIDIIAGRNKNDGKIDPREIKHYLTVKKDEIIAEKTLRIAGVEGRDIYGNIIEVGPGKDKILNFNRLIREEPESTKSFFKAESDGILKISENTLTLSEAMMIPGSVDYSTGNINYSKDVLVKQDVKPKFKVISGGDLIIKGSIEEGAKIKAKGDLIVEGGIVGKSTKIFVEGDASVKFIQDADVYVAGRLLIKTSLIGGKVFTGEELIVAGKKGSKRTQIFGGEYYSFKKMKLHSVGTPYKTTILCCGYNPNIESMIIRAEETAKTLQLQISRQMNNIGFNISDPSAAERIKRLSPEKRKELKEKLNVLRKLTLQFKSLEKKKGQLIDNLYSKEPESLEIRIKDKITPDTVIQFMKISEDLKSEKSACRILLDEKGIDFKHL